MTLTVKLVEVISPKTGIIHTFSCHDIWIFLPFNYNVMMKGNQVLVTLSPPQEEWNTRQQGNGSWSSMLCRLALIAAAASPFLWGHCPPRYIYFGISAKFITQKISLVDLKTGSPVSLVAILLQLWQIKQTFTLLSYKPSHLFTRIKISSLSKPEKTPNIKKKKKEPHIMFWSI